MMVPEAPLEETETGLVPTREGWFVLNAREARWRDRAGRGKSLPFEGPLDFPQVGSSHGDMLEMAIEPQTKSSR